MMKIVQFFVDEETNGQVKLKKSRTERPSVTVRDEILSRLLNRFHTVPDRRERKSNTVIRPSTWTSPKKLPISPLSQKHPSCIFLNRLVRSQKDKIDFSAYSGPIFSI